MAPEPDLTYEKALWASGLLRLAGMDEAGRGALAGPVAVGTVILPAETRGLLRTLRGARDSKLMTANEREHMRPVIERCACAWSVGLASAEEIDWLGIVAATRLAALRSIEQIGMLPEFLLTDFRLELPELDIPQMALVKGDQKCLSIAAASILAKTTRDAKLRNLELEYPGYGLARHKGYGTRLHREMIQQLGFCKEHRRSFRTG